MSIIIDIPISMIEPLFSALYKIRPMDATKLEMKAIQVLRSQLYFELENMLQTENEVELHKIEFKKLFEEERARRSMIKLEEEGIY